MARQDPRVGEAVNFLPADGSPIAHAAWREAIISARQSGLLPFMQKARRSGDVIFEIKNPDDPAGSLTVRRAYIAAPSVVGATVQPLPQPAKG